MRFQKKNYLNTTNGSKLMQHYRNHAPSGIVSLFGSGGGVHFGSNYLFLAFLICTDSHSKKSIEKFSTKFARYDGLVFL